MATELCSKTQHGSDNCCQLYYRKGCSKWAAFFVALVPSNSGLKPSMQYNNFYIVMFKLLTLLYLSYTANNTKTQISINNLFMKLYNR